MIDCNLLKTEQKNIITALHLPTGDRVIILLDYSQSQTNCIVTVRVCASTICAYKSTTLATVFCFSNFPPRHSWECHRKLTVWLGILGNGTYTGKPLENAARVHTFVLPKVRISAFLLEGKTCPCDWLMLLDPGGLCVLGSPCVIETWYTVISQKCSFSRLVRCPVGDSWMREYLLSHTKVHLSCTSVKFWGLCSISILCCFILHHILEENLIFFNPLHLL